MKTKDLMTNYNTKLVNILLFIYLTSSSTGSIMVELVRPINPWSIGHVGSTFGPVLKTLSFLSSKVEIYTGKFKNNINAPHSKTLRHAL
jgi:hypothetical protein